ncbi:thiamine pyrophosphate-binding protein [Nocardioides sp. AE5]|uniref:thiamine pyrophosphate-binding protein n=1 Tax=Nocardioides sp. AE5 TaxID=2962573 RepID=UPI002880C1C6|nr:thiamine pyrophosphate-binding protein [Nocardioides sp. AE5]MDT0201854.1 thiamine pyrophosphate-binding protein [Nocardioides sp. AE5]
MQGTGGEILGAQLVREGVTDVFGVPGLQLDHALDGLAKQDRGLRFLTTRHEQGAAYMADGYARTSGRAGTFMVVPGPGALNVGAALATAYACSSPVVGIVGQLPRHALGRGLGLLHEIPDQTGFLRGLTKWHALARTVEEIPTLVNEAYSVALSGRPRPVAIEVPMDVLAASGEADLCEPKRTKAGLRPAPEEVVGVAARIRASRKPLIYVGRGVQASEATGDLQRVAETLNAPVVMSRNGRGSLSDRHRLAFPAFAADALLEEADLVLCVGTRFLTASGAPRAAAPGHSVILVNIDSADLGPPRKADMTVCADAKEFLKALAGELSGAGTRYWESSTLDSVRDWCRRQIEAVTPQAEWVKALRAGIPDNGVLINDLTQVGYLAAAGYPVYEPDTFVTAGYQGTLGYAFPTGLGARLSRPERMHVAVLGDGGFGWALQELATAKRYGIGLTTVVFNDDCFGNVKRIQETEFGNIIGADLTNPDFVALGEAFGISSLRIGDPGSLAGALNELSGETAPTLIEVPVGAMPSPWHLLVDQLRPTRGVEGC